MAPRSRSQTKKLKEKTAYGNLIYTIFIQTLYTVLHPENKKIIKQYGVSNIIPEYIYDADGCCIWFHLFGKKVQGGWEADHILAKSNGGSNDLTNFQALNWAGNIRKSDKINFLDRDIHMFFKRENKRVEYSKNIRSLRKIYVNETYKIYVNSRVENNDIGIILSKTNKYILVSFNGCEIKVYPDPELFAVVGKRNR